MTQNEIFQSVMMILDEGKFDFYSIDTVTDAINKALSEIINEMVSISDERGLQYLYTTEIVSKQFPRTQLRVLYPRNARIFVNSSDNYTLTTAAYVPYNKFSQYESMFADTTNRLYYNKSYYTIKQMDDHTGRYTAVYFDPRFQITALNGFEFTYLKYPDSIEIDGTAPIDIPAEYHYRIVLKAAEELNTIDAEEKDRGAVAIIQQGQRLTIEGSSA